MYRSRILRMPVLCIAIVASLYLTAAVYAQPVAEQAPSAAMVPASAAVYGATLRNKELFDAVVKSKAYAKAAELDAVKPLLAQGKEMYELYMADPGMKMVATTLLDGLSDEIFFYASADYAEFMRIYQEANMQGSLAPMIMLMQGGAPDPSAQITGMLDALSKNVESLAVPDIVIGMRLKDEAAGKMLIAVAEQAIKPQLAANELLKDKLVHETVAGMDVLTLKMDGSMIPWEEIPIDELTGEPGKYDSVIAKLKSMTVAVSMTLKDKYLLVSIGDDNKHLESLGKGEGLTSRPEFEKLAHLEDKKLRGVVYASADMMQKNLDAQIAPIMTLMAAVPQILPPDIDDMMRKRIAADVDELAEDLKKSLPKPGAYLQASTIGGKGFESVTYDWSENSLLDATKPLPLLNHVGGDPLMFIVMREKIDPESYDTLTKWLVKIDHYAMQIAETQMPGEEFAKMKKFRTDIQPLLERLDKANRTMLIPALKEGQSAAVLDAKLTSTQWHESMPAGKVPLPMLELGLVWGVSDAALLKKGCQEYHAVANAILAKLREMAPDEVPAGDVPAPQEKALMSGSVFYYMFPKEWGLDKRLAPNAGLSETVAVLTMAPLHTQRLLEKRPPVGDGLLSQYKDKPLATAANINFAGIVDAVVPWVEYSVSSLGPPLGIAKDFQVQDVPGAGGPANVLEQIKTGAEVLKCFRGYSSVTYAEDQITVTRGEWEFQDLP